VAGGTGAFAGPVADKAAEAESLLSAGDAAGALDAFDAAADAFFAASPLQFRVALFADGVIGYGQYQPRPEAPFHSAETVTIYLEPVGYGFVADGDRQKVSFTTGLEIRTPGGLILARTDDFGRLEWAGRAKDRSIHTEVSVTLPELKAGAYELRLTLTDAATDKSATATLPFTIVE
jgi:hypothetical protein